LTTTKQKKHLAVQRTWLGAALVCALLLSGTAWAADLEHQVREGDTLYTLSDAYLEDPLQWQTVAEYNGVANPRRLQPGTTVLIPEFLLRKKPGGAEVIHVTGTTVFQPRFGSAQPLRPGERLIDGDVISTADNGSVTLKLADGSLLKLSPNSVLNLDRLRYNVRTRNAASSLMLDQGRVESKVSPQHQSGRFILKTPKMAAGVRGTEFGVTTSAERSSADVLQGAIGVAAAAQRAQLVKAGYGGVVQEQDQAAVMVKALPVAPDLSGLPVLINKPMVDIPFEPVAGAAAYRVRITPADQPDFILYERLQPEARHRVESLEDGFYQLQARAISADGLEGVPAMLRFELDAYPLPPVTLTPLHQEEHGSPDVEFSWLEVEGADAYWLQLAADEHFSALLHEAKPTQARHGLPNALQAGRYYWRVRSVQGGELGPWGDTRILEFRPQRDASPSAEQQGALLVLRWEAEPGQRFEAELSQQPGFASLSAQVSTAEPQWPLEGLAAGDYFFRVKAIDPDGYERRFSPPHRFSIRHYLRDGSGKAISSTAEPHVDLNRP